MKPIAIALLCLAWGGPQALTVSQQPAHIQKTAQASQTNPETVLATFHVKPDQLAAFLEMMPEYWKTLRNLDLVNAEPHLLMQGEENGKPIIIQVFTWKSDDIPDNAPPEIQKFWTRMNSMVEARNGHPGIDFPPMKLVDIEHPSHALPE